MPAYAHGAVPEARDSMLRTRLEELSQAVPIAMEHRMLLRELGSEMVFARPIEGAYTNSGWLVLVRFGAVIESRFGFTREIPLLYSPYTDLQIRTTDGLESRLADLPSDRRSVSTNEVLVWSPDPRLALKLDSWNRPARVLLPMPDTDQLARPDRLQAFIDLLASKLASRDLYSVRGYVTGDQFFGRANELQQLADGVRRREASGVFGLRKTGKTSLLNELASSYRSERDANDRVQLLIYQDLEHLPTLNEDPVTELVQDLAENIRRQLKQHGLRTQEMADLPSSASPSEFRRALDRLLEKLETEATVVLLLDEVEHLCPPNPGPDTSGLGYQHVRQLFGGLRKLVQERDNFAFVLAGLANAAIESAELYGAPNPLFSFAKPLYLGPFNLDEADDLLNGIGRRVSLHWTPEAVAVAHKVSGGHALLLRELASAVLLNQRHARSNIVQVRPGQVHQVIPEWRSLVASHVKEVLPHLRRYYPDEADLATMLIDDAETFRDLADDYAYNIDRLARLGIITTADGGEWEPTPLLTFSREFEVRAPVAGQQPRTAANTPDAKSYGLPITVLISEDESETLERKETLRAHGGEIPDAVIVDQVLKACLGLLNRRGGTVIVGVADDGKVVGVERDINVSGSVDKLVQFVTLKLRDKIGTPAIDLIKVDIVEHDEKPILLLRVMAAPAPVFPEQPVDKKTGLFVRDNNTTNCLDGRKAHEYVQRHWGE